MPTNTLDRIIDKIVETKPAGLSPRRRARNEIRRDVRRPRSRERTLERPREQAFERTLEPTSNRNATSTTPPTATFSPFAPLEPAKSVRTFQTIQTVLPKRSARSESSEQAKTARRRQIDPTTCERDYSAEELEFMTALDAYKRANGRMFPTCSEILEVFKSLGYVKVEARQEPKRERPRLATPPRPSTPAFLEDDLDDAGFAPVVPLAKTPLETPGAFDKLGEGKIAQYGETRGETLRIGAARVALNCV